MTAQLVICLDCGCVLQENTPLEHGGCGRPFPGLCESCQEDGEKYADEMQTNVRMSEGADK